jgi:hypothetical protein
MNPTLKAARLIIADIRRQLAFDDEQLAILERAEADHGPFLDALTAATLLVRLDNLAEELSRALLPLDAAMLDIATLDGAVVVEP